MRSASTHRIPTYVKVVAAVSAYLFSFTASSNWQCRFVYIDMLIVVYILSREWVADTVVHARRHRALSHILATCVPPFVFPLALCPGACCRFVACSVGMGELPRRFHY